MKFFARLSRCYTAGPGRETPALPAPSHPLPLNALLPANPMRIRLLLMVTLALCAFLRFYHLDGYGLWSDEFVTLLIVSSNSFKELVQTCFEVPQPMPPLYFLANKWIYGFFAPGEIGLRALSAAGSVLAGYFLFATGRTLFNAEVGLWGLIAFRGELDADCLRTKRPPLCRVS